MKITVNFASQGRLLEGSLLGGGRIAQDLEPARVDWTRMDK